MQQFENVKSYLDGFDLTRAILPVPVVARYLGVTPEAIVGRIKSGKLGSVRIDGSQFVSVASLLDAEEVEAATVRQLRAALERSARKGIGKLTYDPVMKSVGLDRNRPNDRSYIGTLLGKVSEQTFEEHGFLLSVLVVAKQANMEQAVPSQGFFDLVEKLGLGDADMSPEERVRFTKGHVAKVLKHYSR